MKRYRADPQALRPAVIVEGMTLLYHRPSGTTHVLLPPAPEILDMLADEPVDIPTLAARIAAEYSTEDGGAEPIVDVVAARRAELEAAGLVARA